MLILIHAAFLSEFIQPQQDKGLEWYDGLLTAFSETFILSNIVFDLFGDIISSLYSDFTKPCQNVESERFDNKLTTYMCSRLEWWIFIHNKAKTVYLDTSQNILIHNKANAI